MDLDLNSEQILLRDSIRKFMKKEVAPFIARHDAECTFPVGLLGKLGQFGYLGGYLPVNAGGYGLDYPTWAMMMEEAGYEWLSLRTLINTTNVPIALLAAYGNAEQRVQFLLPLLQGQCHVFSAITEPEVGSNIAAVKTRADLHDDCYIINGRKMWITNGTRSDFGIVMARTFSPTCEGKLSLFLVENAVSPYKSKPIETLVLRSTGTAEMNFTNVSVPRANLLGREGNGLKMVLESLDAGRLNIAMGAVGAAQHALNLSIEFARTRYQFDRPIGSFQLVQKHIVDMTVRVEAARALGYRAACALQKGTARLECSIAKLYAAEAAHEVASMAIQVHGAQGYATGLPIERIFRDTRGGMIPEGTTEMQTLIVGREILGISAFA